MLLKLLNSLLSVCFFLFVILYVCLPSAFHAFCGIITTVLPAAFGTLETKQAACELCIAFEFCSLLCRASPPGFALRALHFMGAWCGRRWASELFRETSSSGRKPRLPVPSTLCCCCSRCVAAAACAAGSAAAAAAACGAALAARDRAGGAAAAAAAAARAAGLATAAAAAEKGRRRGCWAGAGSAAAAAADGVTASATGDTGAAWARRRGGVFKAEGTLTRTACCWRPPPTRGNASAGRRPNAFNMYSWCSDWPLLT